MNLKEYFKKAKIKQKEHKKFLEKLKNKKPKNLDESVQEIHKSVFEKINCLNCGNCCKTTSPIFGRQDVIRISKFLKLKETEFETKFLMIDSEEDYVLKKAPCEFLNLDNSCSIYEVRPKACKEFPHTDREKIYQINHLTIQNTLICPAAYEVVEKMIEKLKI